LLGDEAGEERPIVGRKFAHAVANGESGVDQSACTRGLRSLVIDFPESGLGKPCGYVCPDVVGNATRGLGGFYVRIAIAFGRCDRGMT
jgi:hypothetical protein